ncbi:MAG: GspMb/PilO family protein [Syntrophobacteraceae bacterium]
MYNPKLSIDTLKLSIDTLKKNRLSVLLVSTAFLALLVFHILWIAPISSEKDELKGKVKLQRELAHKYEAKLKQVQSIKENLAKQETDLKTMQKSLFKGNDPYQLAASLGEQLSAKGTQKLDIKTYQVLASKEYGLYQEVHLRFNFMTAIEGLHYFLEQVKNFRTSILVQEINIQKIQRKGGPDLVVNVILAALMEKGEKS